MPKISKIRLTGCKYEGMKKEHENSIFDLTRKEHADHSLFTLANGCGKGVMMQLISQILLPETRWGKNNGNKVISMFYDQRNNLHQFTFHVVLEWILDTVPQKTLITGIAVKSVFRDTGNEGEEKNSLNYFLYTHEHENNGYGIEELPLYDKETGKAIDIAVLENFINENKRDFIKYSQSSVKRKDSEYFRYLESRGIYRSEWLNLKLINKTEGGSGDYFTGASDNKSIFDKVIIPAIGENIKNYTNDDSNSLIEMFKSNLSITKDLPILMKREGDYKNLLIEIKPLIENADSGTRFIEMKDRIVGEGNDIYFILNDQENLANQNIKKWIKEEKRTNEEKKNLEFSKDNIHYNKEKRELEEKQERARGIDRLHREKIEEINENEGKKLLYEINEILFHKKETEKGINYKRIEKESLIKTLSISDIRGKVEELENEIEIELIQNKASWTSIENQYFGYMNYTNQILEDKESKKKKYQHKIDELQKEVNKFELKENELAKKKHKLEAYFDSNELLFPKRIYEDLAKIKEELEYKKAELLSEKDSYSKKLNTIDKEIIKFNIISENKVRDKELLKGKIEKQEVYEINIARKVAKILSENYNDSLLSHEWFNRKLSEIEDSENNKRKNLESIQRTIWEKNIDILLNKEHYFIPNKDIITLKESIEKLGIHVETGSEYLNNLDDNEKQNILKYNPAFLYSLVIGSQREWELIEKNISKELILNNMVPIYIRSEMKLAYDQSFKLIIGKVYELLEKSKYIEWKDGLIGEVEKLIKTESSIKSDLNSISDIKTELKNIEKQDTVLILNQKLRKIEEEISELSDYIRIKEEEKQNINNNLNNIESVLAQNKSNLVENIELIKQMEDFIESLEEIELERHIILSNRKQIDNMKQNISAIDEECDNIQHSREEIRDGYSSWTAKIENIINEVKSILKYVEYKHIADNSYTSHRIPDFSINVDRLRGLVNERDILEKDIWAKNAQIAVLDTEVKHLNENLDDHIKNLKKLDVNWEKYQYLNFPLNEIVITIDIIDKKIKKLGDEKYRLKSELDSLGGSIGTIIKNLKQIENQILKKHEKAPNILEIEDIESELNKVERDIDSNENYLVICLEELEQNKDFKVSLKTSLLKLKSEYPLDLTKGKMDNSLEIKIQDNLNLVIDEWIRKFKNNEEKLNKTLKEGESFRSKFLQRTNLEIEEEKLKNAVTSTLKEMNMRKFKSNLETFKSMESHFQHELLSISNDKEKAEEAMKRWIERASIHIIRMIEALKTMVTSMNYTNEQGHIFPLVKLKGIERLPKTESDITYLLEEYFVDAISKILETNKDIDTIEEKIFSDIMSDKIIFSKALQGRYPTLLVYKMSEKNEFRYARARDEYYTTWEAINKGEGDAPEGSGGQTLSVNTFVIMMIMSFKKKHIGNENPSTVLILDNPFGKASAKHVLDPIFEIADKLNFQLICFAAPEIIKVEISERFPVFWELKIEEEKVVHGGRVIKIEYLGNDKT